MMNLKRLNDFLEFFVKHLLLTWVLFLVISCNPKPVENFDLKINEISPKEGLRTGGDTLVIAGSGLTYLKSVLIDGEECTGLTIASDNIARCIIPAHSPAEVDVIATNSIGETATTSYTYLNTPTITSISPTVGTYLGGTEVEIIGEGFEEGLTLTFGADNCGGLVVVSDKLITCTTAAHSSGVVTTTVTNPDGSSNSVRLFSFRPEPTVDSVSPTGGSLSGGTEVTISGTGFSFGARVYFDDEECSTVFVSSSDRLTCLTPAHSSGLVSITVVNNTELGGVGEDLFTYRPAPEVISFTPEKAPQGLPGETITITGENFLEGATVKIGTFDCDNVNVASSTTITCETTTSNDGEFYIVVTNPDDQTGTSTSIFTFIASPKIDSISPEFGSISGGDIVTISGSDFVSAGIDVKISGDTCVTTSVTETEIICTTGTGVEGTYDVTVTNSDGQSGILENGFTFRGSPTLVSITPNAGALAGGTEVTISGTSFYEGATVDIDGSSCGSVVVEDVNTITCTTTSHTEGIAKVVVTVDEDNITTDDVFFTYQSAPVINEINPTKGVLAGGTFVTIKGENFRAGASILVGGNICTKVDILSADELTCETPSSPSKGPVNVVIINADAQSDLLEAGFNYQNTFLEWSDDTYDYGNASMDITKVFTLSNSTGSDGDSDIEISLGGEDPGLWEVVTADTTCGGTLSPGSSCEVALKFLGGSFSTSSYQGLLIASNIKDGGGETASVELDGAIVNSLIEIQDDLPSDFYGNEIQILTFINSGTVTTTEIDVELTGTAQWVINSNNCTTLAPGATCEIEIENTGSPFSSASALSVSANAGGSLILNLIYNPPI